MNTLESWIISNKGAETLGEYMRLPEEERKRIYDYLDDSTIMSNLKINNKVFLLVHSRSMYDKTYAENFKNGQCTFKYRSLKNNSEFLHHLLWSRDEDEKQSSYEEYRNEGFITICGHSPEEGTILDMRKERGMLRIDTGCGHRGKLALYCIEDDSVEYFDEKEFDRNDIDIEDR